MDPAPAAGRDPEDPLALLDDAAAAANPDPFSTSNVVSSVVLAPTANVRQELPFLVTNWLAHFSSSSSSAAAEMNEPDSAETKQQALARQRIRHAASELASAFSTLGAFGTAARVSSRQDFCDERYGPSQTDETNSCSSRSFFLLRF